LKNAAVLLKALALADWAERNGVDHLHAYWLSTPATVAMIAAVVSGARWSSTAHRWDIYERNAFDLKAKSVAFVRTISQRGADDLLQRAPALRGRIVAMRLGTVLPPPPVPRPPARDFPIVCPAALVPVKGQRDLLQAASLLLQRGVPLRASLAGTGPLLEGLRDEAARLGCGDAVAFEGFVPQATLHRWYRDGRFRACVLASRADGVSAMEGIPAALIEAMAFGVPVVATDSGSIGELVCPQTGLLVAAGDPEALAGALEDVYRDPAAAFQRARRAYERVAARHDVRVQMRRLADALSTERKIA
jgi:colanic acid/amylovoran biosynthesis glycosyltransferase